jgi:hypothetical protein
MVSVGSREAEEKVPSEYNYKNGDSAAPKSQRKSGEDWFSSTHVCIMCIKIHLYIAAQKKRFFDVKNVFELENRGALA